MISIYIKGLLIGIASIIPGISGGTLALILGIYYNIIDAAANLIKLKKIRENTIFLGMLSLGILTSAVMLAKIFKNYILDGAIKETYLHVFFIGLITGSIITLKKEINKNIQINKHKDITNYLLSLMGFLIMLFLLILRNYNISLDISKYSDKSSFKYYLLITSSGIISGGSMILPGISGSLILLSLGIYKEIINIVSQLNIPVCTIFGISTVIGIGITIIIIQKNNKQISCQISLFIYRFNLGINSTNAICYNTTKHTIYAND
ncbi:Integral membrane protein [Borrelia coriaceae ATCC 43381]|uniref:Integral membrane protein n=1 Tax=Borrelia coriaceae ATCC 43381 TaxID=1408429 RepID=W5SWB4_9SPIR|nr:Integral membrane protein [Borrelia coriaceae ATCC 43381]